MTKEQITALVDRALEFAGIAALWSPVPWDDTFVRMIKHFRNDEAFLRLIDRLLGNKTVEQLQASQNLLGDDPEVEQLVERYIAEVPQEQRAKFDGSRIRALLPLFLELLAIYKQVSGMFPATGGTSPQAPAAPNG